LRDTARPLGVGAKRFDIKLNTVYHATSDGHVSVVFVGGFTGRVQILAGRTAKPSEPVSFPGDEYVSGLIRRGDRSLPGVLKLLPSRAQRPEPVVPTVNYLRIPLLGVALAFVLFLPGIIQEGGPTYLAATGQTQGPYLGRWLLLAAAMFLISAMVYAIRTHIAGPPARAAAREVASILTEPHERVVTVAAHNGEPVLVLSSHALYHGKADAWQRIGWADVAVVRWSTQDNALLVSGTEKVSVPLDGAADLVEIAHSLIAPTLLLTTTTEIGTISVRREPHSDHLIWRVRLDEHIDPADPDLTARVDAAIHAISTELGLNS
jgi:hypothetical protein